ncbi:MAG TPA: hypothetical protein VM052_06360 [Candidatus Limnocylindrales bacterium]|nr:hypothetical protein [Candidatus Limnocylindrales bacterium]
MSQRDSEPNEPPPGDVAPASDAAPEPPPDRVVAITRATLRGVDFRKARFDKFSLAGVLFVSCDFRAIRFDKLYQPMFAASPQSIFRDCRFDGADMRRMRPGQARFERSTFDDAAIDGWRTETAEFVGCRFAGALGTVTFYGRPTGPTASAIEPPRKRNEFTENDFRDADLDHVTFTLGIGVASQRLPLSERYVQLDRFPQRLARARADMMNWDVQEERVAALAFLREIATRFPEQKEIFASRVSATGPAARVQTRVWTALERAAVG